MAFARLDQLRVVSQAQDIAAAAEHTHLAHALADARRQVEHAQRRATQTHADGDPAAIAAAASTVKDARRAAQDLTTRQAAQRQQVAEDRIRSIDEVVAQAGRVVDAGLAAPQELFGIPQSEQRDDR